MGCGQRTGDDGERRHNDLVTLVKIEAGQGAEALSAGMATPDHPLTRLDLAQWLEDLGMQIIGPAGTVTDALNLIEANLTQRSFRRVQAVVR